MSTATLDPLFCLRGLGGETVCVRFLSNFLDLDCLATGTSLGSVVLWDVKTRRRLQAIKVACDSPVVGIDTVAQNLLTQSRTGEIKIWKLSRTDHPVERVLVQPPAYGFASFSLFQNETYSFMAYLQGDSHVQVMDLSTEKWLASLSEGELKCGLCMALQIFRLSGGEIYVAGGFESGHLLVWSLPDGLLLCTVSLYASEPITCLSVDSKCGLAIVGSMGNICKQVKIFNEDSIVVQEKGQVQLPSDGLSSVVIRGDSKICATGGWDGKIRLFAWKKLKPLAVLTFHSNKINCLDFGRNGLLAVGCQEDRVSLWSLYN